MKSMNRVMLMGRLGARPELQRSKLGRPYTRLRMATDRFRPGLSEEEREKAKPDWHSVFVWGEQAENCANYLRKGALVFVEGELSYWQVAHDPSEEQGKQYKNAVQATRVHFITYGSTDTGVTAANVDISEVPRNHNAVAHPIQ